MTNELKAVSLTSGAPELGQPTMRQRSSYSLQHLLAAARFSRQCGDVESKNVGNAWGSIYDEQIGCVSATVVLAVASMEANINEYIEDLCLLLPELPSGVRSEIANLLSRTSIREKYAGVLSLMELPQYDKGGPPYQDAALLIDVRNELVHFHPEWHDDQIRHDKLGRRLDGKFELNPFMDKDTAVLFPQRIASHGFTKWAVSAAVSFMDDFAKRISVPSRFEGRRQDLMP